MPELPEVEITRRGIAPHVARQRVLSVKVRNPNLRWRVPVRLAHHLAGAEVESVSRRAKYLLLNTAAGSVIIHLGMSGSLRVLRPGTPPQPHDHVDIVFGNDRCLRFRDPRRFGCVLWARHPQRHRLLQDLGPEPLSADFSGDHLFEISRSRSCAVKNLLMNARVVVGIGNIYASEALYAAGIHPQRGAHRISLGRYQRLAGHAKRILNDAIEAGGTTLRDFQQADGRPGYFRYALEVYGRDGSPCGRCGNVIKRRVIGQRSSFYCPKCQR